MTEPLDAVVVGSGPNGLSAAVRLARSGYSVRVLEAADTAGGGCRSAELTLPGFVHDVCSAIHPTALLSPWWSRLPLAEHGLEWLGFPVSVAHPLDDGPAPLLVRSLAETAAGLGADGERWESLMRPLLRHPRALFADLLGPLTERPRDPLGLARFGLVGLRSAVGAAARFAAAPARALWAGCAAHSVLPLERSGSAAFGLVFGLSAHVVDWACARGGSAAITDALTALLRVHGGDVELGRRVESLVDLPPSRTVLFDTSPRALERIAGSHLPGRYRRALRRYRYGPGTFKLDWALDGPIPWRDPRVAEASTVHVGGTLEEIAASERDAWGGRISDRPFLIVCQQSVRDAGRAPAGKHTGYAYCHVPAGCDVDMTARIEEQVERFAPGFRDRILARHTLSPAALERRNANLIGGAITGGAATLRQLVARPALRWDPYATPDPHLFLCSASTPPGGGVHGMCGYHAANSAIARMRRGLPMRDSQKGARGGSPRS